MNKVGFSLFSFLFYISSIAITCSIVTPFIYKGYTYLISILHQIREESRVENVFLVLTTDIQKLTRKEDLQILSNKLYIKNDNQIIEWSIAHNTLYRKKEKQKKITLQDITSLACERHERHVVITLQTDEKSYSRNLYTYFGISI